MALEKLSIQTRLCLGAITKAKLNAYLDDYNFHEEHFPPMFDSLQDFVEHLFINELLKASENFKDNHALKVLVKYELEDTAIMLEHYNTEVNPSDPITLEELIEIPSVIPILLFMGGVYTLIGEALAEDGVKYADSPFVATVGTVCYLLGKL